MAGTRRIILGCMSGTSLDGVDAAAVEVVGTGLGATARYLGGATGPLGSGGEALRGLASGRPTDAGTIARAARSLGAAHVAVLGPLIERFGPADLIAVHGQTVYHAGGASWQLMDVWGLARAFGVPVVFDLRGADIAWGGHGAPITPLADWLMFRDAGESRCIVNLGGFCNTTMLPADGAPSEVRAGDVCACNQVLDGVARAVLDAGMDEDGAAAMRGNPHTGAVADLLCILRAQRDCGRSLGTGDEAGSWIADWRTRCTPDDLAASACDAIGRVIGESARGADSVYLAGGGARNVRLMRSIGSEAGVPIRQFDALGTPGAFREAAAMAVLGGLCADGVAITLPRVTGVSEPAPVAGAWVFPDGPSR